MQVFTPDEVTRLTEHAGADFLPWVAIIAFGGVRHEELSKGLTWSCINFQKGTIIVPAAIAKTGRKRKIDMPGNLKAWLEPYRNCVGPIFNKDVRKHLARMTKAAEVPWKVNALRHSFGSYRMEQVKNAGQVAGMAERAFTWRMTSSPEPSGSPKSLTSRSNSRSVAKGA